MLDLLVTNAVVVCPGQTARLDVGISGEQISVLAPAGELLRTETRRVIDAEGLYLLPGGVDAHVHIRPRPQGGLPAGYAATSRAAAHGGTTTFVNFSYVATGQSFAEAVDEWRTAGTGHSAVDFGLHSVVPPVSEAELSEGVRQAVAGGVTSFKAFMLDNKGRPGIDDGLLYHLLQQGRATNALILVHAENGPINAYRARQLAEAGKTGLRYYGAAKPNFSEAEAARRAIFLARMAGVPLYVVHVSTGGATRAIREAQREGLPVFGEVCPQHLFFNEDVYESDRAFLFNGSPPQRPMADQRALWDGLADGTLAVISTDDVHGTLADKLRVGLDAPVEQLPGGQVQMETRLIVVFSRMVASGWMSLERFVDLVSTSPARIFGLYPRKGIIAVGSDADLVLFDPSYEWVVSNQALHTDCDYTPFEGWKARGKPVTTILRGQVLVEDGRFSGDPVGGRYLHRSPA
jgi:dihydropyrimidinase